MVVADDTGSNGSLRAIVTTTRPLVVDGRHDSPRFPGVGRYVRNLLAALPDVAGDDRARLLVLRGAEQPPLPGLATRTVTPAPYSLAEQLGLPRLLRGLRAAVYLSPTTIMPYLPGVPSVVTLLDFIPQVLPATVSRKARLVAPVVNRLALTTAAAAIAISSHTRDDARRLFPRQRLPIEVVPLAPDPDLARPSPQAVAAARRRLDLPHPFLLHVGINKPHKNAAALLRAWSALPPPRPDLVFAGPLDERYPNPAELPAARAAISAAGEGPGRVRHLGRVGDADLAALYAATTLFVFPSAYEGFGLPPLEAQACGAPVMAADRASLPEVVGDAAVLIDPDDAAGFADSLRRLLADEARLAALSAAGPAHAAAFTWQRTAAATLQVLRGVAG